MNDVWTDPFQTFTWVSVLSEPVRTWGTSLKDCCTRIMRLGTSIACETAFTPGPYHHLRTILYRPDKASLSCNSCLSGSQICYTNARTTPRENKQKNNGKLYSLTRTAHFVLCQTRNLCEFSNAISFVDMIRFNYLRTNWIYLFSNFSHEITWIRNSNLDIRISWLKIIYAYSSNNFKLYTRIRRKEKSIIIHFSRIWRCWYWIPTSIIH